MAGLHCRTTPLEASIGSFVKNIIAIIYCPTNVTNILITRNTEVLITFLVPNKLFGYPLDPWKRQLIFYDSLNSNLIRYALVVVRSIDQKI